MVLRIIVFFIVVFLFLVGLGALTTFLCMLPAFLFLTLFAAGFFVGAFIWP